MSCLNASPSSSKQPLKRFALVTQRNLNSLFCFNCICYSGTRFKMPRKPKKKFFNFQLRKKRSSTENIEENSSDQNPRSPSPCQETLSLPRPTRAAKQICIENVTNILSEEKTLNSKVLYERKRFRESDKQREQRLKNLRQSASKRLANESIEKRDQRLEDLRCRAALYREKKKFGSLRIKTVDKINQEYKGGSVQSISVTACPPVKQKHSVTDISEFDKCIIKEIVTLFHAQGENLTVQKILDATKRRLDGFNCSYSSMRRILIKLGYKFLTYPAGGKKFFTFHEATGEDEQSYEIKNENNHPPKIIEVQVRLQKETSQCTKLITEMSRRYMSMLEPKEEYEIEIEGCLKNNES